MKARNCAVGLLAGAFLLCGWTSFAQDGPPRPRPGQFGGPMGEGMELLGLEGWHMGKVVSGAPFTGTAVSEHTQTLADGSHITRTVQVTLSRDSQGRVRREGTLPAMGPMASSGQPNSFIFISDPVAGTSYALNPSQKTARKLPGPHSGEAWKGGPHGPEGDKSNTGVTTESLGTQTINGVSAQGTRLTRTIPAGQIGNDKPIVIVSERWYSPDLQVVVKSTHTDPRFGTETYSLTNVQRTEPAASLFAVPSDFTIKEGGPMHGFRPGPGGPAPAEN